MTITNYTHTMKNTLSWVLVALLVMTGAFVLTSPGTASAADNSSTSTSSDMNLDNLFQWVLLDRVVGDDGGDRDLTDLVVLSSLFNQDGENGGLFGNMNGSDNWTDLIVLDAVVGDDGGDSDLRDLAVLQTLFNNGEGTSGTNGTNGWFELLILDRIIGDDGDRDGLL